MLLRAWSYKYDDDKKTFSSDPEHDWASHDGDGYSYGCVIVQQLEPPPPKPPPMRGLAVGVPSVSLEELWADAKPKRERF
jgi:hypothetical protein